MAKIGNREKILCEGLKVVHARGFAGASVRDIVEAAGVPQGSFTNHFVSKEAFGLEILDRYFANSRVLMQETLLDLSRRPLARLRAYFAAHQARLRDGGMRYGCLFGNFTAESSDNSEVIRQKLMLIFADMQHCFALCLQAARDAGELSAGLDCDDAAAFLVASMQGAVLLAKAQRSLAPLERLERIFLAMLQND